MLSFYSTPAPKQERRNSGQERKLVVNESALEESLFSARGVNRILDNDKDRVA